MNVHLKLYGVFRTAAKTKELVIDIPGKTPTVKTVISRLVTQDGFESLKELLVDKETSDPRPNALIMLSGREINTLQGLETPLTENDELALLPVAHGG
jgi:molybdopterin synthase sulfur carrier subunit